MGSGGLGKKQFRGPGFDPRSCVICGAQSGAGAGFSPSTSVSPANSHSTYCFTLGAGTIAAVPSAHPKKLTTGLLLHSGCESRPEHPAVLNEVFRGFHQFLQANDGMLR
jgi:hypothetical protein